MIERREQAGDVAFLLEPDLKYGHGGLRDVQTLWWAADAGLVAPTTTSPSSTTATTPWSPPASPCTG